MSIFPPGPQSGLFGRKLLATSTNAPFQFLTDLAETYGDIVHFKVGFKHIYLLNHPDYIQGVLNTHYKNFLKGRGLKRKNRMMGAGALYSEGEQHRRQRRVLQPSFQKEVMADYAETIVNLGIDAQCKWQADQILDVSAEMKKLTTAVIGKTMFGSDDQARAQKITRLADDYLFNFKLFRLPLADALYKLGLLPRARRFEQAREQVEFLICEMIDERRRGATDGKDLLSVLLAAYDHAGEEEGLIHLRDEVVTVFMAGYETTSTALLWTWYLLGQNPEIEAKLHAELDAVLDTQPPSIADLPRLRLTEKVFAEALRLFPPVWGLVRTAINDYEVGGYLIPKNSLVIVSQYLMHRDRRYFPDPLVFDPERWTPEARADRPLYSYFPFGGGPRRCIGDHFALMEAVLLLATLGAKWRLRPLDDQVVEPAPHHVMRPTQPLRMRLERRKT